MATVKRKTRGVRRSAAASKRAQTARRAKAKTRSWFDVFVSYLPFDEKQLHTFFLAIILGGLVSLGWFVASLAGVPAMAQQQIAFLASDAGFEVRRVSVTGVDRMNELMVYERALAARDQPMPLVNVNEIRADLLQLSWIKDARVSRQLPDTIVVDVVERVPHAALRKPGQLVLIDPEGVELEPISSQNAKRMLILSGAGAGRHVGDLSTLLETAPALKPLVKEAEWVGNRRWDLTFNTNQKLALPQGRRMSAKALVAFARLDGVYRLLGGKVVAFDMRAPGRTYLRIPGGAQQMLQNNQGS